MKLKEIKMENQSPQFNLLQEFEYQKTTVLAGISPLGEMIAIKPICENLGIDRKWQQDKIKSDPRLEPTGGMVKVMAADGKTRPMYCLPPNSFQEWLWSLTPTENMNLEVWEAYKKGLVVHLLIMLKTSLDEIKRLRNIERLFENLKKDTQEYFSANDQGLSLSKQAKDKFKEQKDIKARIIKGFNINPNQTLIDF